MMATTRKPLDLDDAAAIAATIESEFRDCVEQRLRRMGRRPMHDDELDRISAEVEQAVIRLLEEYVREFEPLRDRESLIPAKGGV